MVPSCDYYGEWCSFWHNLGQQLPFWTILIDKCICKFRLCPDSHDSGVKWNILPQIWNKCLPLQVKSLQAVENLISVSGTLLGKYTEGTPGGLHMSVTSELLGSLNSPLRKTELIWRTHRILLTDTKASVVTKNWFKKIDPIISLLHPCSLKM